MFSGMFRVSSFIIGRIIEIQRIIENSRYICAIKEYSGIVDVI